MKQTLILGFLLVSIFANAAPELRSGDLIFQTSKSDQAFAIMWASNSQYSHVGVIEVTDSGEKYVVEAIRTVSRTPLSAWIARGVKSRYTVLRYPGLDARQEKAIVAAAKSYLGRGYDIYFSDLNDEIYCSELTYLAFKKARIGRVFNYGVGRYQKIRELNVDNPEVRALVKKRWQGHPLCKRISSFEQCWSAILASELITPASQAEDSDLTEVFSNYP